MGCKRLCIVDIGNWKCCMECEKHEECNILCDDLDQYEYMEECPDYVKEKNQMKYSEKLKPCPFCGKKAEQDRSDNCDESGCCDGEEIFCDGRSQGRFEAFGKAIEIVGGGVNEKL